MSSKHEAVKQQHIMTTKRQTRTQQQTGALEEILVKGKAKEFCQKSQWGCKWFRKQSLKQVTNIIKLILIQISCSTLM